MFYSVQSPEKHSWYFTQGYINNAGDSSEFGFARVSVQALSSGDSQARVMEWPVATQARQMVSALVPSLAGCFIALGAAKERTDGGNGGVSVRRCSITDTRPPPPFPH